MTIAIITVGYGLVVLLFPASALEKHAFWKSGESQGREVFWEFLKNLSLASEFLLITAGIGGHAWAAFINYPVAPPNPRRPSSHRIKRRRKMHNLVTMMVSSDGGGGSALVDEKTGPKSCIPYWHLRTDDKGVSHQRQCNLTEFELKVFGGADLQWNNKHQKVESTVVVTVQPGGWVGDWHENPAPQWIVVLSGRWWIESMDNTPYRAGRGRVSFGEDQGCSQSAEGRKGQKSGTIGTNPRC